MTDGSEMAASAADDAQTRFDFGGEAVGVIHARGGSKRIPRKNVKPLLETPLIGWCVRAALASRLDRVIVSTDDDEISEVARRFGAEVPFRRPADIAEDVPSERVTQHAIEWLAREQDVDAVVAVTLQPTTPFLQAQDIDACLSLLHTTPAAGSAITVKRATQPLQWMLARDDRGFVRPVIEGALRGERGVIQSLPVSYLPNGAVYATRRSALWEQDAILAEPMMASLMSDERSVDLDEPLDWIVAEAVGRHFGFMPTLYADG